MQIETTTFNMYSHISFPASLDFILSFLLKSTPFLAGFYNIYIMFERNLCKLEIIASTKYRILIVSSASINNKNYTLLYTNTPTSINVHLMGSADFQHSLWLLSSSFSFLYSFSGTTLEAVLMNIFETK